MKKLRILVLMHEDLVPPDFSKSYPKTEYVAWKTEFDVVTSLRKVGHEVIPLGVYDDLGVIRKAVQEFKPHITFNLLEEFEGNALYDHNVVSCLQLMHQHYTGCNPRGLMLAHDKALSKKVLSYHRIRVPGFKVIPRGKKIRIPKRLKFPLFVKSLVEEGSYGISQASIVRSEEKFIERVSYLHDKLETHVIAEEYIEGRDIYLSILGNERVQVLPILELVFGNVADDHPRIATSRVKWDWKYQKEHKIETVVIKNLPKGMDEKLIRLGKRVYRALNLSGYARIDLRLSNDGEIYVLEANANPDIGCGEEMHCAAKAAGMNYEELLHKILNLGLRS